MVKIRFGFPGGFFISIHQKTERENQSAERKQYQSEPCSDNDGMKQDSIGEGIFFQPVVIMHSVGGAHSHSNMSV